MMKSVIVNEVHKLILNSVNKQIAIDATCGNGNDTVFLCQHFEKVYAFDIQTLAIERTRKKTKDFQNLVLINDDFRKIETYLKEADCIVFNLGYLPGSDRKVKTSEYDSKLAILKAYDILKKQGSLIIAVYTKHEGGLEEYQEILGALEKAKFSFEKNDNFSNGEILIYIKKNRV